MFAQAREAGEVEAGEAARRGEASTPSQAGAATTTRAHSDAAVAAGESCGQAGQAGQAGSGAGGTTGATRGAHRAPSRRPLLAELALPVGLFALTRLVALAVLTAVAAARDADAAALLGKADGGHLLRVAEFGYEADLRTTRAGEQLPMGLAFFPLYPLLIRLLAQIPGVSYYAAGVGLSAAAGLVAAALVYLVGREVAGRRTGIVLAVLFGAQPTSVVLSMVYTEALFVALAAGCLLALLRSRWLTAGLLCALAGATRMTGLALIAAVLVAAALAVVRRQPGWSRALLAVVIAPAGLLAFLAFAAGETGRIDGWWHVQANLYRARFDGGLDQLDRLGNALTQQVPLSHVGAAVWLLVAFVGLVLLVAERRPLPLLVYALTIYVLAFGQAGYMHSKTRLLLPAFPLLLGYAAALARSPRRVLAIVLPAIVLLSGWYGAYMLAIWPHSP